MGLKIETYKPLFGHRKKPNFPLTNAKYSQRKGRALLDHHCDECFKQFHTCQFAEAVGDCSFYVSSFGCAFGFLGFWSFWRWRYRNYGVEALRYERGWCSKIADFDSGIGEGYFSLLTILSL